ncbi:CD74 molecule, major histocompatibility complex, class II invariant chain a [Rhinichthys klamathensis goyatoka]|uniref:CD74 molecule, major histocompatibility complex, class II invariant chain a n=1 Tax=Rhinichthys klamathensis goyatoka TaxID=3034132 RepID=UPI0024B5DBAA|nr:CD74 molecule, major histocompatibility complex, class II invariant chain a [Rhinichthys klamathensis goyatoka]
MDEHDQNDALIQRVPSQETILSRGPTRNPNGKALKVAGLTVLACLLLAGQALTAYFVWGQKEHLSALTSGQEKLKTELTRKMSAGPPKAMHLPMNSMALLKDFSDETSDPTTDKKKSSPLLKLQPVFTNQREGSGQLDGGKMMPKRMNLPMRSLPLLVNTDEEMKATPQSAVEVESKCELDSEGQVRPGYFKPQCDEQGNYKPMQCWHSTGYCWCVDTDGKEISGTRMRGRPQCDSGVCKCALGAQIEMLSFEKPVPSTAK